MESPFRGIAQEQGMSELRVIETMRWDGTALVRLERHLARMQRTCAGLGFAFDIGALQHALDTIAGAPKRVRVTCGLDGVPSIESSALSPSPAFWRLQISPQILAAGNPWLRIKTTERRLYDATRAELPNGIDEVIFLNTRGEVCEGTITNVFADFGGGLLTPAVFSGLLPGILREEMLERGECREAVLLESDLRFAKRLFAGNALRGLIPAQLA